MTSRSEHENGNFKTDQQRNDSDLEKDRKCDDCCKGDEAAKESLLPKYDDVVNDVINDHELYKGNHLHEVEENNKVNGEIVFEIERSHGPGQEPEVQRETWGKKIDFLLSVTGFAVDLGNVWRFPYICYKNGGGAFLIPYFLMLVFMGLPLFYMELALGQYQRSGCIVIWKQLCPMFKGVGFAICLVATYVGMYYNTIIAWAFYYMFASFRSELPWASCHNDWNTPRCFSITKDHNMSLLTNMSIPSALEYFQFSVLQSQKSTGIGNIGGIKWDMCLCLLLVMAIIYFALWKGIKSSGKAVWVTATVPYIVLLVLLVRGATLPGSADGIKYYVTPVWSKLLEVGVWLDAAAQIFFSLGPGFGTLLALSSYNKFHNNCYMDAMLTASINCLTSLLAGFVVFSVLGYMAHVLQATVEEVALEGPGLVFYVYPEAIATLSGSVFWAVIFFLLLITLGIDSTFGGLESVITGLCDMSPKIASRREVVVLCVVIYCFLGALATTTYGGQYVITLLDTHAAPVALIFICLIEAIAVNWFYGTRRFSRDIERMLGYQPGIFWKVCWSVICPVFLFILFVLSIVAYQGLSLDGYKFPVWSQVIGWMITFSSLTCIPVYIVYSFIVTPGTWRERLRLMIQPTSEPKHPKEVYRNVNGNGTILHLSEEHTPMYSHDTSNFHETITAFEMPKEHNETTFTEDEIDKEKRTDNGLNDVNTNKAKGHLNNGEVKHSTENEKSNFRNVHNGDTKKY